MKRTRQHVIEDEAEKILRAALPATWIFRKIPKDYGVDYEIELVDCETVSGNRVWFQLKGTERAKKSLQLRIHNKDGTPAVLEADHIVYDVETDLLKYVLKCDFPLLLALADLSENEVYWLPLRDEIEINLERMNANWRDQKTARLHIHPENRLSNEARHDFYGIRWYAMEPARMRAAALLHSYYHEMEYKCHFSGYSIGEGLVDEPELLRDTAKIAHHYFQLALEVDCLFGPRGWDLSVHSLKPVLQIGLKACEEIIDDIDAGRISFKRTSGLLFKIVPAFQGMSTCITSIQNCKSKFLLTPESVRLSKLTSSKHK